MTPEERNLYRMSGDQRVIELLGEIERLEATVIAGEARMLRVLKRIKRFAADLERELKEAKNES